MNFTIARIIGNELAPRDKKGSKISCLKFILKHKEEANRIWILNRINDKKYLEEIKKLLKEEEIFEIPFIKKDYKKINTFEEKIKYAVNINAARNYGLKIGLNKSDFISILDGDCFFSKQSLKKTITEINEHQKNHPDCKYYGVPTIRIENKNGFEKGEPMIIFRKDSDQKFDENIIFGNNDKIELINRLNLFILKKATCFHSSFSDHKIESDLALRISLRQQSLVKLVNDLNSIKYL